MLKENLEKERPSAWKLAFYLMDHSGKDLADLPAGGKVICVNQTYEEHFLKPIVNLVASAIESADRKRIECKGATDRRSRKFIEATELLDNKENDEDTSRQRAERIVSKVAECR